MKTFNDLYNSLKSDFTPQTRTIFDLGVILSKLYEVLAHDKLETLNTDVFANTYDNVSRTIIERLIFEIKNLENDNSGVFIVESEGIERAIADIKTLEISIINPLTEGDITNVINSGLLIGYIKYFAYTIRQGLFISKSQVIKKQLLSIDKKDDKLNYLYSIKINIEQDKPYNDEVIYNLLLNFVDLEIDRWEKQKDSKNEVLSIKSSQDLFDYLINLINNELIHNIRYLEGYKVFWRDEKCNQNPKKENEIHHFIKSVLKPHCELNKISITRENAIANGFIDFTFRHLDYCICIEVKKADHKDVKNAINTQLTEYMKGEKSDFGIYLVLWYKTVEGYKKPLKYNNLDELISKIEIKDDSYKYSIIGVDCTKPISPSKIKE